MKSDRLERALGYTFLQKDLLKLALSHRSVGRQNNERLEFLGDSLLGLIITEYLYKNFPSVREGDLTRVRSSLVKGDTLAQIAQAFSLGEYLYLGEGELKSGGFRRASILADAVEAVIGAIYLESGMDVCRQVVLSWYEDKLAALDIEKDGKDAKTLLQEYLQKHKRPLPVYETVSIAGESHAKEYTVECSVEHVKEKTLASSSSKRNAEKLAAEKMLTLMNI